MKHLAQAFLQTIMNITAITSMAHTQQAMQQKIFSAEGNPQFMWSGCTPPPTVSRSNAWSWSSTTEF